MEFIKAALPWVVIGITLAIVSVVFHNKKKEEDSISEGIGLGMCFGVAIGSGLTGRFGSQALAYGICFGMLAGLLYGKYAKKKKK